MTETPSSGARTGAATQVQTIRKTMRDHKLEFANSVLLPFSQQDQLKGILRAFDTLDKRLSELADSLRGDTPPKTEPKTEPPKEAFKDTPPSA